MALVHKVGWEPTFTVKSDWYWPIAQAASRFAHFEDWPSAGDFEALHAEAAREVGQSPLRFAANVRKQDKRSEAGHIVLEALYDARITQSSEVPTRERDWHDFFNMLCFVTFPRSKRALHARHYRILKERIAPTDTRLPNARTPEQDALTLFDEGGVIVVATPTLAARMSTMGDDLEAELIAQTHAQHVCVVPFGHALFEHLVEGLMMPGSRGFVVAAGDDARGLPSDRATLLRDADGAFERVLRDDTRFLSPREQHHVRLPLLRPLVPRAL
jgi:hypothetical protein